VNLAEEEFGLERLSLALAGISRDASAQTIADLILAETDRYTGSGVPPHDDRTLIVLRVTDARSSDFSKLPVIY